MTSLTLVRRIAARPSIVFDALTTAEGIATWWGPDDGPVLAAQSDVRVGGDYLVRFRMQDGSEHEARGEYLEMVRPKRVVMSFRWAFGGAPEEIGNISRVEMELRAIGNETELTFTHANLIAASTPSASKPSHEQGWSVALDKLVHRVAAVDSQWITPSAGYEKPSDI
jgi:uncharacterized protein YndB with AHSA1/START domain